MNIDFIKDPATLQILETILGIVGPNYNFPHDSDVQPSDGLKRNDEDLTQYDVPGGTTLKSVQPPSANPGMGSVISSLLTVLAPIISAYGFILPILGIIKAIIEILCCLMNPFCVIPAVIRLFTKYLPPFISLFPPAAAAIIMKSTIKLMIAILFFIMTEIVPAIQLIITLVECVVVAFQDDNFEKAEACKKKLLTVIIQLLNKLGILGVLRPLLEIIFRILQLVAGVPCGSGGASSRSMPMFFNVTPFDASKSDTACCNDLQCPPEIANPPTGQGLLVPTFFGDAPVGWSWILIPITGHENIPKLIPYLQDFKSQLDPQLDEEIDEARPVGSTYDAAHFRLRILGRRGEKFCKTSAVAPEPVGSTLVPIARISGYNVIITNRTLFQYAGLIDYCIEPNYEQLIGHNILAVSCHPDVIDAKAAVEAQFAEIMEQPAIARFPELLNFEENYATFSDGLTDRVGDIKKIVDKPIEEFSLDDIPQIEEIQGLMLGDLNNFANNLKDLLNVIVSRMSDKVITTFEVDKHIVKAGGTDKAIVSVTPRDVTGTSIMKNMPSDTILSVEIFTDFGILQNQVLDGSTGVISAELISPLPGNASVTAKVNKEFIETSYDSSGVIQVEQVQFIADAVLPKRRHISKSKSRKGVSSEREPGNR